MTLYESDFVTWTRQQAALIRALPADSGLDIEHLSEEIEAAGRTAVADLSTSLRQLLTAIVRRSHDPGSVTIEDILAAQSEAVKRSDAGVWQHIDLDRIWKLATRRMDGMPKTCPFMIQQLIAEDFDIQKMIAQLA
jgi:hypothetical protein